MNDLSLRYRRNGKNIYIKQPDFDELQFVADLWADKDTMKDIGGAFIFEKSKWELFYKKMVLPTDGNNFYCLIYLNSDDAKIGEVSFHGYDSATKSARFNIKIKAPYRNHGYAREAMTLLMEYYFFDHGGKIIIDNISNEEGIKFTTKMGFEVIQKFNNEVTVRLTKEDFCENKVEIRKKISILAYEGMSMSSYYAAKDVIKLANVISDEKLFDVETIAYNDEIIKEDKLTINIPTNKSEIVPNVIIIPGFNKLKTDNFNKDVIKYIQENYNKCDYILAMGNTLKAINSLGVINSLFVPKSMIANSFNNIVDEKRILDRNYVDNGKIMLSGNKVGDYQNVLRLIEKMCGKTLEDKVKKQIGLM